MSFPSHNIDPRKKDEKWHLDYCKAMWEDAASQPKSMFYHNAQQYDRIKSYAHGRQDTAQYKKAMHIDEQSNTTYAVLDFKVLPIVKKHRQIALGKLQKSDYNIVATPIDALARNEADKYFAVIKAKIMLRNELMKQNPELAQSPLLQPEAKEPLDMEELEMQMEFGYKHNYAIEVEQGVQLIFNQNEIKKVRHKVFENLFDEGVAVIKDWMEPDGKVRFRVADNRSVITNSCRYYNFSDLLYCGEVIDPTWNDFREQASGQFDEQQFEKIYDACKAQNDSYRHLSRDKSADKFKVKVLDIEWFSVDEQVYEEGFTQYGNPFLTKTDFKNKGKEGTKVVKKKNVYRAKWVVGTDFIYDFGLASYIKRPKGISETELSYHIVATNFHDMKASGIMEDLIPIADQVQIAWLKLQNIRNQLIPYAFEIDLDALEDVALSKGGEAMQPKDLLQMLFQNGILISRRKGLSHNNPNYKTIQFVETNYGTAIAEAWNDLQSNIALIREATGFNELTDGSTPNPKTLTTPAQMAYEATNNSLYQIVYGEECLLLKLAKAVLCRMVRAVKMGKVEGYIQSLGTNTVKFISVSPEIGIHDFGLMLENKPTPEQKNILQQMMAKGMQEGTLEPTDIIMVENCFNLKQAEQILAFRIKKRKEEQQQRAIALQQQNGQIQIQSAQAAENEKRRTNQEEYALKKDLLITEKQLDLQIKQMELQIKYGINQDQLQSKEKQVAMQQGVDTNSVQPVPIPENVQESA